jgi:hypothetical protein
VEQPVPQRKKRRPALKHGAFSETPVLPGENPAEFKKLHRALIADLAPRGALEDATVARIACLVWRQLHTSELARKRPVETSSSFIPSSVLEKLSTSALEELYKAFVSETRRTETPDDLSTLSRSLLNLTKH